MPRKKSSFNVNEMSLDQAKKVFDRKRGRGSKYDEIIDSAEKLDKGKALIIEGATYSEVQGMRQRISKYLSDEYTISATKMGDDQYDVLIHREK